MSAEPVRYVCIVCFAAAASEPCPCARDGVPLSPLTAPEVLAALRGRMRRRATRRERARAALALAAGLAIAWPLCTTFHWQILPRAGTGLYSGTFAWVALLLMIALGALSFLVVRPLPDDGEPALLLRQLGLDRVKQPR